MKINGVERNVKEDLNILRTLKIPYHAYEKE